MGWKKTSNTAQFYGASWNNLVCKESNCTPEEARRIAFMKPEVTFYFFCREYMSLGSHGVFNSGDAVFFSGEPWLGSAPQCDTYEKEGIAVAYVNPKSVEEFKEIASYTNSDGSPAIDVVCIFAANYCTNEIPMLRANNNDPPTTNPFNQNIQDILSSTAVKYVQDKGIVVLLTILNGHSEVGWSQFNSEITAQAFVKYLDTEVVQKYGLDGIDIDDEYSQGVAQSQSLAMVTTLMKKQMPLKLITKALFDDIRYFFAPWNDHYLAGNLDYGWQMSYSDGGPIERLRPYADVGMNKKSLALGFSAKSIGPVMKKVMSSGYGGGMLFDYAHDPSLMKPIVNAIMHE